MKEFKKLTESQVELLQVKSQQVRNLTNQAQVLLKQNMTRIERMKTELGIPAKEARLWQFSKDGKNFEREKKIKKDIPGNGKKGKK